MTDDIHAKGNQWVNITTATTTVVCPKGGVLHTLTFNKPVAAGTITMYDHASAASGSKIGTITFPATVLANQNSLIYDIAFSNGLTIVTVEANDITVSFRQT